jgi:predicted HicB family RNase H-like nuclease
MDTRGLIVKQVVVRIPADLHRRVKVKAARLGVTITSVIRSLLEEWVDE